MTRDASLSDFVDGAGSDGTTSESATETEESASELGGSTGEQPAPDPVVSTSKFAADASSCAACGSTVGRTWRDGEDLVCHDCKDW